MEILLLKLAIEVKLVVGHSDLLKPIKTDFVLEVILDDFHWSVLMRFVLVSKLDLLFVPSFSVSKNYSRVCCFRFTK